jgi:hypothetical protein
MGSLRHIKLHVALESEFASSFNKKEKRTGCIVKEPARASRLFDYEGQLILSKQCCYFGEPSGERILMWGN